MIQQTMSILLLGGFLILASCSSTKKIPETVAFVDLNKYSGKWYEIASYPQRFQKGCEYTTAEYRLGEKEMVVVENRCKRNGKISSIRGKASVVPNSGNAKLKVSFFWPFKGDYWIIDLADDYSYAVVSSPGQNYLWILSRSPKMEESTLKEILERLKNRGFDLSLLQYTRQ